MIHWSCYWWLVISLKLCNRCPPTTHQPLMKTNCVRFVALRLLTATFFRAWSFFFLVSSPSQVLRHSLTQLPHIFFLCVSIRAANDVCKDIWRTIRRAFSAMPRSKVWRHWSQMRWKKNRNIGYLVVCTMWWCILSRCLSITIRCRTWKRFQHSAGSLPRVLLCHLDAHLKLSSLTLELP